MKAVSNRINSLASNQTSPILIRGGVSGPGFAPLVRKRVGDDADFGGEFPVAGENEFDEVGREARLGLGRGGFVRAVFLWLESCCGVSVSDGVNAEVAGFGVGGLPEFDFEGFVFRGDG